MANLTIGDLASTFQMRRFTSESKANMTRLAQELTSGYKSDLGAAVAGDFGPFAGIERSLRAVQAYKTSNSEASTLLTSAQLALENIQTTIQDLSPGLLTAASARDITLIDATSEDARQKFDSVVSNFNTRIADRSLFAGAATDGIALASANDMLADLGTVTAGMTTAADIETAVEAWFDDVGGGFETIGYIGSTNDMGNMIVADGESVAMSVRADDQVVRDTLKGFAMAALISQGALSGDVDEQANLIEAASSRVLVADTDLITLRAEIGTMEERVENAQARNAAEAAAYELAKNDIIAADPYETATLLETTYAQIEMLYTITAKMSDLRFTNYVS